MKFYQSNLSTNILVFALGLFFIISPTALTSTGLSNTNSFYPDLFLCLIFATALNRPKIINLYAILTLLLFSDVLHMKPIGLFTILMFMSVVIIRRYKRQIEQSPFYIHYLIFRILYIPDIVNRTVPYRRHPSAILIDTVYLLRYLLQYTDRGTVSTIQ